MKDRVSAIQWGSSKKVLFAICAIVFAVCITLPLSAQAGDKLVVKNGSNVTKFVVGVDPTKVGIDTDTPTATLQIGTVTPPNIGTPWDIYSYNSSYGRVAIDSGANNAGLEFLESTARKWFIGSFNGNFGVFNTPSTSFKMWISPTGNIGIGTTTPTHLLQLAGGAYSDGNAWYPASSRALKENISELGTAEAMNALVGLNPVKYNYKNDKEQQHVGFIAEDVPELVALKDRKALSPMDIVAVLTKVVQEQQKTITALNARVDELNREVKLKNGFAALETK